MKTLKTQVLPRIIISGGGSGGHIFPALAIANQLKQSVPDTTILFVGAKGKMEMEKIPEAGYEIQGLWISGIQRRLTLKNLLFPLKLLTSLVKSYAIIGRFKPDIAIGVGGFASGPLLRVAAFRSVPTLIQEQNSFPGITNRWLSSKVDRICVSYDNMKRFFPEKKILKTGNPVRMGMVDISGKKNEALEFFGLQKDKPVLLVVGGSLGARSINQAMIKYVQSFQDAGVQVIWQTGKIYYSNIIDSFDTEAMPNIKVLQFIKRMDLAYAAADIVVSRAGAMSISELCIVAKPTVFVPSPNVSEDHQSKNAQALLQNDAAILVKDSEVSDSLYDVVLDLIKDKPRLSSLSDNISKMADVNATRDIVDEVLKLLKT